MASSSQSASLTSRCIARTLPPSTCRAIGSMDLRARGLNCPTIELKNWSRGSCRVKHARKAVWNPRSSSIKASISLRVSANWGMANGSSAVRQAGNIFCLLVLLLVYGNRYQENGHVSIFRCRCRAKSGDDGVTWRAWRSWGSCRLCQFLDLHIRVPALEHLSQFAVQGFHADL